MVNDSRVSKTSCAGILILGPQAAMAEGDRAECWLQTAPGCRNLQGPICGPCWNDSTDHQREAIKARWNRWIEDNEDQDNVNM